MSSASLENTLIQLKMTARMLDKSSKKAKKAANTETEKLKKVLRENSQDTTIAQIHATNVIRKNLESANLLKLSSRVDAVSSRIELMKTMRSVSTNMASVTRALDKAMASTNLSDVASVMDTFESQVGDMDVHTAQLEGSIVSSTAMTAPPEEIDALLRQVREEAGIEVAQRLGASSTSVPAESVRDAQKEDERVPELVVEEDVLASRLRALRPNV